MNRKKKRGFSEDVLVVLGLGLLIVAVAVHEWLKTPEGQTYQQMSIEQLTGEMWDAANAGSYNKAIMLRDLINQKKQKS